MMEMTKAIKQVFTQAPRFVAVNCSFLYEIYAIVGQNAIRATKTADADLIRL
jgi:hypothetical protein